jgi:hypothetical protein
MAYLDLTVLNDFQAREAVNEKLTANYGMIDLAQASGQSIDYIPPSVMQLLSTISASRGVKIPALKDQTVTVGVTPGFSNIPANIAESATFGYTAVDVFSGFRFYPASFENNQMDAAWYRDQVLRNVLKGMAVYIDDLIEVVLEARKSQVCSYVAQVSQGGGAFTFDGSTHIVSVAKAAVNETMFWNLVNLQQANQVGGEYRIVTSPGGLVSSQTQSRLYGPNTTKDLSWNETVIPPDRRYVSDQLAASSDIFNGFFVRDGEVGLIENFPFDFRNGTVIAGKQWSITDVALPYTKMRANIFINTEATDATSIITPTTDTNLTMTTFEEMAIWHRFFIPYRYNSALATYPTGILKISGKTT